MTTHTPVNRYASPLAQLAGGHGCDYERRTYLAHENAVRSVATLYLVSAAIPIPFAIAFVLAAPEVKSLGAALVYGTVACGSLVLSIGLQRLEPAARIPSALGCGLGFLLTLLLAALSGSWTLYVLATALGCGLYLLFSPRGRHVFTPEYRSVVAATPHLGRRTSPLAMALLAVILLCVGAMGWVMSSTIAV